MIKAKQRNLQKTPAKEPKKPEARDDMLNKILEELMELKEGRALPRQS